jgi:outer membrane protein assembly factor BamB
MRYAKLLLALSIGLVAAVAASSQKAPGWPQWRGPNGDGVSAETGWNPAALKVLWKAEIGYGYSNVVIQDGRVYAMGAVPRKGLVFTCLDAVTGTVLWQQSHDQGGIYNNPEPQATPVVDGDRVYGLSTPGVLICLQAADGQVLWKKDLVAEFKTKGTRYYGIALNKHTGDCLWVTAVDEKWKEYRRWSGALTTPVVCTLSGRECALFVNEYALIAVELATGATLWSYPCDPEWWHVVQDPVVSASRVLLLGGIINLDCSEAVPRKLWSSEAVTNDLANPVLVDGYLYGYRWDYSDRLGASNYDWMATRRITMSFRCVDWNSGSVMWQREIKGGVSLIAVDAKLIMLDLDGTLRIVKASPAGYEELAAIDVLQGSKWARLFPTPPAFCDGRIYCRNFNNDLVCIDVRP